MLARLVLVVVALTVAALPATPATAAPNKPFALDVAPAEPWAGETVAAYTVTLTNNTDTQELGSANITIPAAFTVVGAPSLGTVTDHILELRNLGIAPHDSLTVTLGLRMPCVSDSYTWGVEAKQSNDFSGPPGNALGPVSGNRTTTVQGSCKLRFVNQPAATERNEQIRAEAFQPDSEQLVTVEAIDGSPTPQRLTWFGGTVELRLVQSVPGTLSPNPASSTAIDGLASFSNMSIDESGNYNLRASTTAAGFSTRDSARFQVIGVVEPCRPAKCEATIPGDDTTSTLLGAPTAGDGFALLSLNLGTEPVCDGYRSPTNEWYEFQLTVDGVTPLKGDKTVTTFYSKAAMRNVAGPSALEICFAAPLDFPGKLGTEPFDYDGDPSNGAEGFVGLLQNCPRNPLTPCVLSRNGTTGGSAIVTFLVPAAWGDPRYSG